jgi:superfamily II DNA or RNA helicase
MPLTLHFDKGTILLAGKLPQELMQAFVWDDRVHRFRACASHYRNVVEMCAREKIELSDLVFSTQNDLLKMTPVSLRPYQEVALLNWKHSSNRGIVCLPTGAGKTRVALAAIAETCVPTLCIVPTRVLLEQWQLAVRQYYLGPIGVIGDNQNNPQVFTLATFESAYRKMAWLGNRFHLLIIDECHHFGAKFRDEIFLMNAAPMRLGLTATKPKELEQIGHLERLIGPIVSEVGIKELVGNYLAPFDLVRLRVRLNPVEKTRYVREYAVFTTFFRLYKSMHPNSKWRDFIFFSQKSHQGRRALSAFYRTRRLISLTEGKRSAVRKIVSAHRDEKIIIFTTDTDAAYELSRQLLIMPITADIKRKEREWALAQFKTGDLKILVSCKVLNEGVDVPDAAIAVIVGGTAVEREFVQRIGRILRPSPGKHAVIYELVARDTHEERQSEQRCSALGAKSSSSGFNFNRNDCDKRAERR